MHNIDLNIPPLCWVLVLNFMGPTICTYVLSKELNCMFALVLMHHAWLPFLNLVSEVHTPSVETYFIVRLLGIFYLLMKSSHWL